MISGVIWQSQLQEGVFSDTRYGYYRIGSGDGFVGGLLYGMLKEWDIKKCAKFGWPSGTLAAKMLTGYAQHADEEQLWSIWEGNIRVKR